jgi:hypothetical protein
VIKIERLQWQDYLYRIKLDLVDIKSDLEKSLCCKPSEETEHYIRILKEDIEMLDEFNKKHREQNEEIRNQLSAFEWKGYKKYGRYE